MCVKWTTTGATDHNDHMRYAMMPCWANGYSNFWFSDGTHLGLTHLKTVIRKLFISFKVLIHIKWTSVLWALWQILLALLWGKWWALKVNRSFTFRNHCVFGVSACRCIFYCVLAKNIKLHIISIKAHLPNSFDGQCRYYSSSTLLILPYHNALL